VEEIIKFRPHHFLCTLGFQGHGYSLGFVKNYKKIVQRLTSDENTLIEVVGNMDSICFACPNKINESLCTTQSKITKLDSRHQQILGLKIGEILSWKEAKVKIKKYMTVQKFDYTCDGCSWKEYGICQKALENMLKEGESF
jgi:hypothetical protein